MSNMFKAVKAKTIEEYFLNLPTNRIETINFLHSFIQKNSPKLKPHFAYNMLGYGIMKYKNYQKKIVDWPIVALANQKNYFSIYICVLKDGKYIPEKYKNDLGKVSVGKSCIRFKKLEDLNLEVLKKVLKDSAKFSIKS